PIAKCASINCGGTSDAGTVCFRQRRGHHNGMEIRRLPEPKCHVMAHERGGCLPGWPHNSHMPFAGYQSPKRCREFSVEGRSRDPADDVGNVGVGGFLYVVCVVARGTEVSNTGTHPVEQRRNRICWRKRQRAVVVEHLSILSRKPLGFFRLAYTGGGVVYDA